ncbi:helix-turn-helix domain-containing protein [Bacilliculturomica massiliensis]|uniref:helix-turn-helix domain-containing protein n=1 Tax=Bacilliculturomica massiliensis TaxID=1917867 RepID=UPI001030ED6D|nr:helix-turn-helix transcriptional regulator [Bacilliculturomica massiliensis]
MSLGENISRQRREKNMSQGDLAGALDVSRQSVSRWETDGAVPELDKLIKLSDIFGVTLDELVKGEKPGHLPETAEKNAPEHVQKIVTVDETTNKLENASDREHGFPPRKIVGTILLCTGLLVVLLLVFLSGSPILSLLYASPILLCSVVCFLLRQRIGLWCGWIVYFTADIYLRFATGINWRLILFTLSYTPEMNYIRLYIAWIQTICMILLVILTILSFKTKGIQLTGKNRTLFICGWVLLAGIQLSQFLWFKDRWFSFTLSAAFDWTRLILLTALIVAALCGRRPPVAKKPG